MTFLRSLTLPVLLVLFASLILAQSNSVLPQVNLTFTTIDVPGAVFTGISGINGLGDMVGDSRAGALRLLRAVGHQ